MSGKYEDMLDLPYRKSLTHPHMSMHDRAAQFSPFAALTGYEEAVTEEGRLTQCLAVLEEFDLSELDRTLKLVEEKLEKGEAAEVELKVFVPDEKKEGGSYDTLRGSVRLVDRTERKIVFSDRREAGLGYVVGMRLI